MPESEDLDPSPDGAPGLVGAGEAAEAAFEGVPAAISLAPSTVMPSLGGELLIPTGDDHGDVGTGSVRAGIMQAGPLALAGVVANGANVIVTVILARLLTTEGYGSLNQLIGLFLVVSMPGSAVVVAVVRRVTSWDGTGSAHLVRRWAERLHRQGTTAVVIFALAVLAGRNWVAHTLGQHDGTGAAAILIAGAVWILLSLDRGLIQAHRSYRVLAVNLLVEGGMRTVALLTLVGLGFGAAGAAVGILITEVVTAIHARVMGDRIWAAESVKEEEAGTRQPEIHPGASHQSGLRRWLASWEAAYRRDPALAGPLEERRLIFTDLITALIALAMVALLQNVDVIVLGRENSSQSGSYAAVSVSSKALVFGAVVLGYYLLPEAAIRWRQGSHALRQLAVVLLLLAIPAVFLLAVAFVAPDVLLSVVFSHRYLGAEDAFGYLVLAMTCLSITVVLTMYLLAVGRRWIAPLLVVGAVALTLAVTAAHGAPVATARNDLVVQAILVVITTIGFIWIHHRRLRHR